MGASNGVKHASPSGESPLYKTSRRHVFGKFVFTYLDVFNPYMFVLLFVFYSDHQYTLKSLHFVLLSFFNLSASGDSFGIFNLSASGSSFGIFNLSASGSSFGIFWLLLWYLLVTPLVSSGYSFGIFWLLI
jgi:hypothetical protein